MKNSGVLLPERPILDLGEDLAELHALFAGNLQDIAAALQVRYRHRLLGQTRCYFLVASRYQYTSQVVDLYRYLISRMAVDRKVHHAAGGVGIYLHLRSRYIIIQADDLRITYHPVIVHFTKTVEIATTHQTTVHIIIGG